MRVVEVRRGGTPAAARRAAHSAHSALAQTWFVHADFVDSVGEEGSFETITCLRCAWYELVMVQGAVDSQRWYWDGLRECAGEVGSSCDTVRGLKCGSTAWMGVQAGYIFGAQGHNKQGNTHGIAPAQAAVSAWVRGPGCLHLLLHLALSGRGCRGYDL